MLRCAVLYGACPKGRDTEFKTTTHRKKRAILDRKNTMAGVQVGHMEGTGREVPPSRSKLHMSATGTRSCTPPCTNAVLPITTKQK